MPQPAHGIAADAHHGRLPEPVRDELHAKLAHALRPGGILMIGSTERVANPGNLGLTPVRPFTYRKA